MNSLKVIKSTFFKINTAQSLTLSTQNKIIVDVGNEFKVRFSFKVGNHVFVELDKPLSPVGKIGYFFADHVDIKVDEFRGVWLTNVASNVLSSENSIKKALEFLKEKKFNTLYPVVWNGNYTLYESDIANSAFGKAIHPQFTHRDMMKEILDLALDQGFRVIPWFEYGLMTLPNSDLVNRHPDWFTLDPRGNLLRQRKNNLGGLVDDDHIWLNPIHPEVIQFITDLIGECIQKYPTINGIQIDDHFGMPKEMGYDPFTTTLYQSETGISVVPKSEADAGWSKWVDWRVTKVTNLMRAIFNNVKRINQDCLVSLSPNPQSFSRANYMADWTSWESESLINELIVQIYRDDTKAFENELKTRSILQARDRIPTGIGIFTGYQNDPKEINLIKEQTQAVRDVNFAGFSYFFYETLVTQIDNRTSLSTIIDRNQSSDFDFLD
jgi:uncharacterized lipoprotein YddW (UPF0748 family)